MPCVESKKSIHHSFNTEVAAIYGTNEAILIHHFQHWIAHNAKLKRNFHEGSYWTYQSLDQIAEYFHYLSKSEIFDILNFLCTGKKRRSKKEAKLAPVLKKGNFNKTRYDRTVWYAFCDQDYWISKKLEENNPISILAEANMNIGNCQSYQQPYWHLPTPIPDTKHIHKNKNTYVPTPDAPHLESASPPPVAAGASTSVPSSLEEREKKVASQEASKAAQKLLDKVLQVHPKLKKPKLDQWAFELDRMHRCDNRSWEEIDQLIDYTFDKDPFWVKVIQSPQALRRNFDKIWVKKSAPHNEGTNIRTNREFTENLLGYLRSIGKASNISIGATTVCRKDPYETISMNLPPSTFEEVVCKLFNVRFQ